MGQVTIYLDNETQEKMKKAAASSKLSVSKWVAGLIREKVSEEWPDEVISLAGSWKDDFSTLAEIRRSDSADVPRKGM
ncbi:MAG: CopG family transcriptional regulator [Desulfobia sp.]